MIYAVFDTNVFVSALLTHKTDAATIRVVDAMTLGRITPLYNDEIIAEYNDVMHRSKFPFAPEAADGIVNIVKRRGLCVGRTETDEHFVDATDMVFYEIALSKEGSYLITGNTRHFPKKPIVVTPAEMLEILKDRQ